MSVAAYQYEADDRTIYQVVLPTDFAAALDYTPASGLEPYLPTYIQPRYSTYQSAISGVWANVVVPIPFQFAAMPQMVAVGSIAYSLQSSYGESRLQNTVPQVMLASGPQGPSGLTGPAGPAGPTGPAGPAGASADIVTVSGTLTSAMLKAIHTTPQTIIASPGAGKVIVPCSFFWKFAYGGIAYSGSNALQFLINTVAIETVAAATMTGTASRWSVDTGPINTTTTNIEDHALTVTAAADYTTGNSTLDYSIDYRIVDA